jgi:hypothetical protein
MSDTLRREAEAFVMQWFCHNNEILWERGGHYKEEVDALVAFAKAQRSAEVRAFQARIEEHHAKDHWYFKSIKQWLDQRAKEWAG